MSHEIYKRWRPQKLVDIVGQPTIVKQLSEYVSSNTLPHSLLFCGDSGTGKTSAALIISKLVECNEGTDFQQINGADERGIDVIRSISDSCKLRPMVGKSKVFYVDEAHKLTNDAQNAMLTLTEDTPQHVYFMLSTTIEGKIIKTLRSRFTTLQFRAIPHADLVALMTKIVKAEKIKTTLNVLNAIADASGGSARVALVTLEQITKLPIGEQLQAISVEAEGPPDAYAMIQALWKGAPWKEIAPMLKGITTDLEVVRQSVLSYANTCLLGNGGQRAAFLISLFQFPFHDSRKAGLTYACYQFCHGQRK
jgi:DNA polymerase III gamma/tau subunit